MQGLWTGLWATVQDLKEARVDPSAVLQALDEARLRTDDPARLAALLRLHAAVLEVDRALRLADPDDLAALAMERVTDSAFLQRMARICYYGFYDLTQGQLDFFKAVARAYPATLFFPLRGSSSASRFAQRFFETYVQGLAGAGKPLTLSLSPQAGRGEGEGTLADEMAPEVRGACCIVSAVGIEDEVSAAAKEILRLIEDHGYDPTEIGVLARAAKTGSAVPADDDTEQPRPAITPEQMALLFDLVSRLYRALSALPDTAGWDAFTEAYMLLLPEYFRLSAWETGSSDTHTDR